MNDAFAQLVEQATSTDPDTLGPIEVFRVGAFTDMSGNSHVVTLDNLKSIADGYDAANHPAPIVIGHPNNDAPAYGWIERFWIEGDVLKATISEAAPEFVELVRAGRYKRVSISLFPPNSDSNPVPGTFYARHVGFLGAAAPAVPGLKPIKFAGSDTSCFAISQEFAAPPSPEQIELEELRRASLDQTVEKLIEQGQVLPAFKEDILSFASHLSNSDFINFADGSPQPARDWFFDYLSKQPPVISFGALDLPPGPGDEEFQTPALGVSIPDGYTIDRNQSELAARTHRISRDRSVSFATALDMILNGEA